MHPSPTPPSWTRHFVYRTTTTRTTWKFRIGLVALVAIAGWLTSGWWTQAIARSLVCDHTATKSDAILVENFDPGYLPFERARELREAGLAMRVLVPVPVNSRTSDISNVESKTTELLASLARLGTFDVVPFREAEPISLNAARDIQRFLESEHIRSVIVVSPLFRSRRSLLVYEATLGQAGIAVRCEPAGSTYDRAHWTETWHGLEDAAEQWLKLQYYRVYVLPFRLGS